MSVFVIGNFLTFTHHTGAVTRWQNYDSGSVTYNGIVYPLLPFIYRGAQKTRGGDNISSQLILPANPLTLNWVQEAVNNSWLTEVQTYQLDTSYAPQQILGHEYWIATGLGYTAEAVELQLSSAIDAVGAQAPNARITRELVGALPSTGNIRSG